MTSSLTYSRTPLHPQPHIAMTNNKRTYCQLDMALNPVQTARAPPCKRPRRILTPSSVISAVTADAPEEPQVSPPPPYDPTPASPAFDPSFHHYHPYSSPVAYAHHHRPASPPSPIFDDYPHPVPLLASPPSADRSDEDIQADITNSFSSTAGNCGTVASWSTDLFVQVLANEVEELIYSNDDRTDDVDVGEYQTFYSSFKQPFELDFYMRRLVQYVNCSPAVFVAMFVYLDRVQEKCKALLASDMNCHRLVFTCLVLAVKNLEDEVHSNAYYARVGGLTIEEMNSLEVKLLNVLEWNLTVSPETYGVYEEGMMQTAGVLVGANEGDYVVNID